MMETKAVATISLLLLSDEDLASRGFPGFLSPLAETPAGPVAAGTAAARSPEPEI